MKRQRERYPLTGRKGREKLKEKCNEEGESRPYGKELSKDLRNEKESEKKMRKEVQIPPPDDRKLQGEMDCEALSFGKWKILKLRRQHGMKEKFKKSKLGHDRKRMTGASITMRNEMGGRPWKEEQRDRFPRVRREFC